MTSSHSAHAQHSTERLLSSIFRRIRKGSRKADSSKEDPMHVTDAETESATTSSGAPPPPDAEAASLSGGDETPADDSGEAPLPDFLTLDELQQHRVKPANLPLFSERLSDFVRFLQRVHDLARATYDHPAALQRRLERDLGELRSLLAAVRDAVATVQRLRAQRSAVRKEKAQLRRHLRKLRDEEVREMESIVAVYDKAMYARWENVRHTHKADALNALLNDVKGKQQAMENLCVLIQRKQGQLQGQSPCGLGGDRSAPPSLIDGTSPGAGVSIDAADAGVGDLASAAAAALSSGSTTGTGANKRHVTPGSARTVALRRRRHHERQDAQSAAAAVMAANAGASAATASRWEADAALPLALALPLPAPAPPSVPTPDTAAATLPPAASGGPADSGGAAGGGSTEECSGGGCESAATGGAVPGMAVSSPSLTPGQGGTGAARAAPLGHTELHEMRGVLQALFSDLRIGSVANIEDIDLFAVRPSQASNQQ